MGFPVSVGFAESQTSSIKHCCSSGNKCVFLRMRTCEYRAEPLGTIWKVQCKNFSRTKTPWLMACSSASVLFVTKGACRRVTFTLTVVFFPLPQRTTQHGKHTFKCVWQPNDSAWRQDVSLLKNVFYSTMSIKRLFGFRNPYVHITLFPIEMKSLQFRIVI